MKDMEFKKKRKQQLRAIKQFMTPLQKLRFLITKPVRIYMRVKIARMQKNDTV